MVSSRTRAIIRSRVNMYLTERCTIEREAGMTGLMGEPLHGYETVAEDVPCRIIMIGQSSTRSEYDAVGATEALVERWRLICPAGTAFAVDERVRLADGRLYQIVDVDDRLTDEAFVSAVIVRARDE